MRHTVGLGATKPMIDQVRRIADVAWQLMRTHAIAARPRNYEVWFTYCSSGKPLLNQRLDAILKSDRTITPGLLDQLHREFFATGVDVLAVRDGSGELQQIATEMADRVSADRGIVETLAHALGNWSSSVRPAPTLEELQSAAATLGSTSAQAGDRLGALEKLFTASIERIGDLKEKLTKAEQDATLDALTGLANRRSFDAQLLRAARQATVGKSRLSLAILDVDHFKRFNDTYGHTLGDQVLRLIARILTENTKGRDTAARYGGEEFAIILPDTALNDGVTVAEHIRTILGRRPVINRVSGQRLGVVTCSIGVAQYRPGEPVGELVNRADQSLYRAKREGRNTVRAEELVGTGSAA